MTALELGPDLDRAFRATAPFKLVVIRPILYNKVHKATMFWQHSVAATAMAVGSAVATKGEHHDHRDAERSRDGKAAWRSRKHDSELGRQGDPAGSTSAWLRLPSIPSRRDRSDAAGDGSAIRARHSASPSAEG